MKLVILGSCVTRDVLRVVKQDRLISRYLARTCLPSVVSPPLRRQVTIVLDSPFQTQVVHNDLYKELNAILTEPNLLILMDCIEERFDILATEGTYITRSFEAVQSGVIEQLGKWVKVNRHSTEGQSLWSESCQRLAAMLHPSSMVILHRAPFATEYLSGEEQLPFSNAAENERNNEYQRFCWGEIERYISPVIVEAERTLQVATDAHMWGLRPYHYIEAYYVNVWQKIQEAAGL